MKRREFIGLIGSAAVTWPVAARAQQMPTIGLLGANSSSTQSKWTEAFFQRLHELGWIEGNTVAIEARWAEGRSERYGRLPLATSDCKQAKRGGCEKLAVC
jgi:putative ABC transport system substrate-binding protein